MKKIKHLQTNTARIAVILALLIPYSFSFGDEEASLTVENATSHYLHVIMNGESFLYIGPGRTASLSANDQTTIFVQTFYAPGQGIEGTAQNSFVIGGTLVTGDCSTNTCTTEPAHGSTSWRVTPDLLVGPIPSGRQEEAIP